MNLNIYRKTRYQSIYKHKTNDTYAVDINLGYSASGKRIRTTRTGLLSIEDAKNILMSSKIRNEIKVKISNKIKFKEMWINYMYDCEKIMKLSYNTLKKKKYGYNLYISKYFDDYNINDIEKQDIVDFHDYLDSSNLSDRTKNDIHKILSAFLNWCLTNEKISKNAASTVPNYSYDEEEKQIWSKEQFQKFIDTIEKYYEKDPFKAVFVATIVKIFFLGGIRLEELLALKKRIISENGIYIKKAVIYENGIGHVEKDTKTKSSQRIVDFGDKMIETINNYIEFIEKYYSIRLDDNDYIFINIKTSKLYSDTTIRKWIKEYCVLAAVPELTPHCLRHSHATLLHDQGWDMFDISKRLGHSNTNITQKIYCHFSSEEREKIAQNMDDFI